MSPTTSSCLLAFSLVLIDGFVHAETVSVPLTRLEGLAGPANGGTAIYVGDLGSLSIAGIRSMQFTDSNSGVGGATGRFSGFDLDAIKVSESLATTASEASAAVGLDVFDFTPNGTEYNPGTQRPPTDPKFFGTDASGVHVDPDSATLDVFDGVISQSGAVTLGDGGSINFILTSTLDPTGKYVYVGELSGSAGEQLLGTLEVSSVPEPDHVAGLFCLAMAGFCVTRRHKPQSSGDISA